MVILQSLKMAGFTSETFKKFDDYMTPNEAWDWIFPYIPKDKIIWEPFYGDGKSGEYLKSLGLNVIHEDNVDFFENDLGDIIVSNPPFTKKKEVLERLKKLDKPFILIMPASVLTTKYSRSLFEDKIQVAVPPKRIQFIKLLKDGSTERGNRCNFDCLYYCYKMDLYRDIIYLDN